MNAELAQVAESIRNYCVLLDDALAYGRRAAQEHADSDDDYRVAHAQATIRAKDGGATDALAKAHADVATEGVRRRARLAESMDKLALEAIRSRRTQVSAQQTLLNAEEAEVAFSRTGPREVAA